MVILKKSFSFLFVVTIFLLSTLVNASASDDFILLTSKINNFKANFKQTIRDEFNGIKEQSNGEFLLNKPNQFVWKTKDPYEQTIITDGETLWIHDIDLDQVNIQVLDNALGSTPALLLGADPKQLVDTFEIATLNSGSKEAQVFELKPKLQDSAFQKVLVLFKNNQLAEISLDDSLGQKTSVVFSSIIINEEIAPSAFQFNVPENVDVIDSRQPLNANATRDGAASH